MGNDFPVLEAEKTELVTHVEISAQRYRFLEHRLNVVETKVDKLIDDMIEGQKSLKTTIITSTGTVVAGLLALIVTLLMKLQ